MSNAPSSALSPRERFVHLVAWVRFGKLLNLKIENGEPSFSKPPRVIYDIKLKPSVPGTFDGPKTCMAFLRFFSLIEDMALAFIDEIHVENGRPKRLKIGDALVEVMPRQRKRRRLRAPPRLGQKGQIKG